MKVLFVHNNFPAQYVYLATALGRRKDTEIVFLTENTDGELPGVRKVIFDKIDPNPPGAVHFASRTFENHCRAGHKALAACIQLKQQGFTPDIIHAHSGWGAGLFLKDVWPDAGLVSYMEWFFRADGPDFEFLPNEQLGFGQKLRVRTRNASILIDLASADACISPTQWQRSQFPAELQAKIQVIHDGVPVALYKPSPESPNRLIPTTDIELPEDAEVITYIGRGMEEYRGFPQAMRAIERLQKRRPNCHAIIVGSDRIAYGTRTSDKGLKDQMLSELDLDPSRTHWTGHLGRKDYLRVLQLSCVHIYLTVPFVLSWSFMEALSAGCSVVCSDTQPVLEVVEDNIHARTVDFFDHERIADRVEESLTDVQATEQIRRNARQLMVDKYSRREMLQAHFELMKRVSG